MNDIETSRYSVRRRKRSPRDSAISSTKEGTKRKDFQHFAILPFSMYVSKFENNCHVTGLAAPEERRAFGLENDSDKFRRIRAIFGK